ncbi:MAG: Ribosome maturation factor RimM [Pseudomonadota bacterium]|jgi:16S rRNA processing protein RimM
MRPPLEAAQLPADAVEVGRIMDAWGIQGGFKVLPHSASPEALFSSRRWFLLPPERTQRPTAAASSTADGWREGALLLPIGRVREHSDALVATSPEIRDRNAAETLKGARIMVSRAMFPTPEADEYYWVDLIGLRVINRESVVLGEVRELLSTGPQTVLVITPPAEGVAARATDHLVPFVSVYIDGVDLQAREIRVDWQPDY